MRHLIFSIFLLFGMQTIASPVNEMLDRIDPGASKKFKIELQKSDRDFFELDQEGDRVVVRGNTYVNIAVGVNWYLKYHAGIHLSWNGMKAKLPDVLPPVTHRERHETDLKKRYDLNYCTYSYSMAFGDWERWEREIDWMALHGINMPLSIVGMEAVWKNVLTHLGYTPEEIGRFIAGPAFLAWWHMNNLEGWGGPATEEWYAQQVKLQQRILNRMKQWGIDPVFPGYAGMLPNDAREKLGVNVADPGKWCGFRRPAFLQPTDPSFERIAGLYYAEMEKLFGKACYYSIDPFHEGGNTAGVDLAAAGEAIMKAMKKNNPQAVWVIQAWQANPRPAMIDGLKAGDLMVLDLSSENRPMWGDPDSPWYREKGYGKHDWLYCMLLNFGGNVGMYGRMDRVIEGYYLARNHPNGQTMVGVGITPEGIENNPVMYELLFELPWRAEKFTKEEWIKGYVKARYGTDDPQLLKAWEILAATAYNCPRIQEGTTESVFCARPGEDVRSASSWGSSRMYYAPGALRPAAEAMLAVADWYRGNNNFEYDLVDIVRQTLSDRGNELLKETMEAYRKKDKTAFATRSKQFLDLILAQDELLSTRPEFMLGTWLEQAKKIAPDDENRRLNEWNARTQITTWGDRTAADDGGLRDYAHKEWNGLLKDFYYPRWEAYFRLLEKRLQGEDVADIDWYALEEPWTRQQNIYPVQATGDAVETARRIYRKVF
ncbi:alpha-N-acetylglucosaminidase [Odoribacter lunatus]|uniref:alpha-N-acetylglucosaminidase n=1 Tax=Odoribacter lunatus TaxID=2941335 RepID=UPI003B96DDA0